MNLFFYCYLLDDHPFKYWTASSLLTWTSAFNVTCPKVKILQWFDCLAYGSQIVYGTWYSWVSFHLRTEQTWHFLTIKTRAGRICTATRSTYTRVTWTAAGEFLSLHHYCQYNVVSCQLPAPKQQRGTVLFGNMSPHWETNSRSLLSLGSREHILYYCFTIHAVPCGRRKNDSLTIKK